MNSFTISGHLGQDPRVLNTEDGEVQMVFISIGTNRSWIDRKTGERVEKVDWLDVTFGNGLAAWLAAEAKQGEFIAVTGRIEVIVQEDRGENRSKTVLRGLTAEGPAMKRSTPKGEDAPAEEAAADNDKVLAAARALVKAADAK